MKRWWHKRSLKLRLALWYALTTALVLGAFVVLMDQLVEHWLRAETDRQLRIDFDMIEPQLETNERGELRYLPRGAHGDEGFARLLTWFEIWSEDKQLLMRHWPVPEEQINVNQMVSRSPLPMKVPVSKRNIIPAFSSASSALIKRDREPKEVRAWGWRSQR